ncbi:hypothetical protein B9Z19DRAFT_606577 [Tuber borchii]|uniref:Uncharacterized protein n=1 Tax=Tuber borchii TaxID=42251 RepID=A0A2T7A1B2_TUBBO|nr:hypothetical protein B9Z19DRAFT_606577 [Tuber borchii]
MRPWYHKSILSFVPFLSFLFFFFFVQTRNGSFSSCGVFLRATGMVLVECGYVIMYRTISVSPVNLSGVQDKTRGSSLLSRIGVFSTWRSCGIRPCWLDPVKLTKYSQILV